MFYVQDTILCNLVSAILEATAAIVAIKRKRTLAFILSTVMMVFVFFKNVNVKKEIRITHSDQPSFHFIFQSGFVCQVRMRAKIIDKSGKALKYCISGMVSVDFFLFWKKNCW